MKSKIRVQMRKGSFTADLAKGQLRDEYGRTHRLRTRLGSCLSSRRGSSVPTILVEGGFFEIHPKTAQRIERMEARRIEALKERTQGIREEWTPNQGDPTTCESPD